MMYKQCRTEQSSNRQRILEQGLLDAMIQQHYDSISVSDLCSRMGIPRKSFYRYFSGKEGALHALIDHALLDYENYPYDDPTWEGRTVRQEMERTFSYWKHCSRLLDALEKSGLSGVLIERAINHSILESSIPVRILPNDNRQMRERVTGFTVCGLMAMVVYWHPGGYVESPEQMAQIAMRLVTKPLFTEIPRNP